MRYIKFEIENFKGIKRAELDLSKLPSSNVFTLVGLNESGKTTILEAINSFSPDQTGMETLIPDAFRQVQPKDLVPKSQKANFNDSIIVRAYLRFDRNDIEDLKYYCLKKHDLILDTERLPNIFTVERVHKFESSNFKHLQNLWSLRFYLRTRRARKFKLVTSGTSKIWQDLVISIRNKIPTISYFPTFLFEFPERIYLSNPPSSSTVNSYYVQIIKDILDSLDEGLDIEQHIVNRITDNEGGSGGFDFMRFWRSDQKSQIDAVMLKIGSKITDVIFSKWNEIFGIELKNKKIEVYWNIEPSEHDSSDQSVYLTFSMTDGESKFEIVERSLGFRWFFCFLLFTQFRVSLQDSGALFLFDEPASNLHSRAQEKLLESFDKISENNNVIIYSTHSHYMINPRWLEGAFIAINDAIDYNDTPDADPTKPIVNTNIHLVRYRDFVGQNPDAMTYFQPILDRLDYAPGKMELIDKAILVEGKGDFYALNYFKFLVFKDKYKCNIIPSSGANDIGPLISLYLGWGRSFGVLLDDDAAGRKARTRYQDEWLLSEGTVGTLASISEKFKGKKLEGLITTLGRNIISTEIGKNRVGKKDIARFFQGKVSLNEKVDFDDETTDNFRLVLEYFEEYLS